MEGSKELSKIPRKVCEIRGGQQWPVNRTQRSQFLFLFPVCWGDSGPVPCGNPICVCPPLDVQPPEGRSRDGLLTVNLREGSRLHLCAETRDDAM